MIYATDICEVVDDAPLDLTVEGTPVRLTSSKE